MCLSDAILRNLDKLALFHLSPMKPAKKIVHENVDGDLLSRKHSDSPGFSFVLCFAALASEICDGISIRMKIGTSNCHICMSRPSIERLLKQIYLSELNREFRF